MENKTSSTPMLDKLEIITGKEPHQYPSKTILLNDFSNHDLKVVFFNAKHIKETFENEVVLSTMNHTKDNDPYESKITIHKMDGFYFFNVYILKPSHFEKYKIKWFSDETIDETVKEILKKKRKNVKYYKRMGNVSLGLLKEQFPFDMVEDVLQLKNLI